MFVLPASLGTTFVLLYPAARTEGFRSSAWGFWD